MWIAISFLGYLVAPTRTRSTLLGAGNVLALIQLGKEV